MKGSSRRYADLLSRRPVGVPLADDADPAWRRWYASNLIAQMAAATDAAEWQRLEHTASVLLAAVRRWQAGIPNFSESK